MDFTSRASVLGTAQTFEDLGVRAYNGAAQFLDSTTYLVEAGKIVSVEGRHASMVRRLSASPAAKGWIVLDHTDVAALQPIYAGEAETTQAGVNVPQVANVSAEAASAAFDEPLSKDDVLAIAAPFIASS